MTVAFDTLTAAEAMESACVKPGHALASRRLLTCAISGFDGPGDSRMLTGSDGPNLTTANMNAIATDSSERPMSLEEAVWVDPARMSGTPCFRGTRLPVQQLFDWLEDGVPLEEFLSEFEIDPRAATAVLRAGAKAVSAASIRKANRTPAS